MPESASLVGRIAKMRDEAVADFSHELLTNPRFAQALGAAVGRVIRSKERLDRNLSALLSAAGVPSKADYDRLAGRAASVTKAVGRIEERIDDLTLRIEKISLRLAR